MIHRYRSKARYLWNFFFMLMIYYRKVLAARPNTNDLEYVLKLVEDSKLRIILDRIHPIEQIAEAMKYMSKGHARGKVVIRVVY